MVRDRVTGRSKRVQNLINLFPKSLRLRFNPRRYSIETFVRSISQALPQGTKVLDAGAGPCPYKPFFSHCTYEATDFTDPHHILDFVCSLDSIPKKASSYDVVLLTEVLEHVEYPQKVIDELHRILKKGGKLILTTPQEWMVHQKPHNYYYFTLYGLHSLLKNAGFKTWSIKQQGGFFWVLGDLLKFNSLAEQYMANKLLYWLWKVLEFPFTQLLAPFILFHLDGIDKKKDWTMGYNVIATK